MDNSWPAAKLLLSPPEESYDRTFSVYRCWIGLGVARGDVSNLQIYHDVLNNTRPHLKTVPWLKEPREYGPCWVVDGGREQCCQIPSQSAAKGQLIHTHIHPLLRLITDAE